MNKVLKVIIITIALVSTSLLAGCQGGENSGTDTVMSSTDRMSSTDSNINIAVVDIMEVMQEAPAVKAMQAKIDEEAESKKSEMQTLYQDVQKAQAEADKITGDDRKAGDEKVKVANEKFQQALKAMQMNQQSYAKQIEDKVEMAISEVAKAKGLHLVLIKQVAPYADVNITDVTEDVIRDLGTAE